MPYTCAFVEELFRFRTITPLALIHKTDENAQLGKWIIPKGTRVSKVDYIHIESINKINERFSSGVLH